MTDQSLQIHALLTDGLSKEIEGFKKFKELLFSEQDALIHGDTTTLSEVTETKDIHTQKLNELAAIRSKLTGALGFTDTPEGIRQWINQLDSPLMSLWDDLLNLAKEIQHLNDVNGKLIKTRLQYTQQSLSALLTAVNQANLYGPSGQPNIAPQSGNVRGIIGKA